MSEFQGLRVREVGSCSENGHHITFALYRFPCGTERIYVEAHEDDEHAPGAPRRVHEFATAVHILQNVEEIEGFQIGNRPIAKGGAS